MTLSGQASLVVLATETAPDDVSELLGLVPSETHLNGASLRSGRVPATTRAVDDAGIPHTVVNLTENPDAHT